MDLTELNFDFDTMVRLARHDPYSFAHYRDQLIRGLIAKSSRSERLADLQFDIDAVRYGFPPGMRTAEKMIGMMVESAECMLNRLGRLNDFVESARSRMKQ